MNFVPGLEGLGIIISLITGTAAGLLSLLTWEILKRSPFGRAVLVLTIAMALFTVYHGLSLFLPASELVLEVIKSGLFTGLAVFILLLVAKEHRMRKNADNPGLEG